MPHPAGDPRDYLGRQFDLLALRGATPINEALLSQTFFDAETAGEVCAGSQLVAQLWAIEFCTIRGSVRFDPERGNDFLRLARQGRLRTEFDVEAAFAVAAVHTRDVIKARESDALPAEDRLDGAELLELVLAPPNLLSLRVRILTLAGADRRLILPIPLLPIRTGV